jgi:membrane protein DedA with SNARE-associated domain
MSDPLSWQSLNNQEIFVGYNRLVTNIQIYLQHLESFLKVGPLAHLGFWNYILLSVLVAVEGPVATLLGAVAASSGLMQPGLVFLFAALGNLTADSLWYMLGYLGKIEWLFHGGRILGVRQEHLQRLQHGMRRHTVKILFFAKLSVSFVIPSLIAAGLVKAPWRRWFPALLAAETLWTGSLVLIGYYTTEALKQVEQGVEVFVTVGSILFLGLLFWFGRHVLGGDVDDRDDLEKSQIH